METFIKIGPISALPIIVIGVGAAAIAAYYFRRRRTALILAVVAIAAITYAVAWTFSSG